MDLTPGDRLMAWTAASLAATWAAILLPVAMTAGLALVALYLPFTAMIAAGLPLALLAKSLNWTGWSTSAAAGAIVGVIPALWLLVPIPAVDSREAFLFTLFFAISGAMGGVVFRAVLGRYGVVGHEPDLAYARREYRYRPSPWPAATFLIGVTAVGLAFCWLVCFSPPSP